MMNPWKLSNFSYNGGIKHKLQVRLLSAFQERRASRQRYDIVAVAENPVGDEGKARLQTLSANAEVIARYQGVTMPVTPSWWQKVQAALDSTFFPKKISWLERVVVNPKSLVKELISPWRRGNNRQPSHFWPCPCHPSLLTSNWPSPRRNSDNKIGTTIKGLDQPTWMKRRTKRTKELAA